MRKQIIIFILIILASALPFLFLKDSQPFLRLGDSKISLLIARTRPELELGLGGRQSLPENQAMFFVFNHPDIYKIWMKDMKFPVDIFWLDENFKIVHIEKNISPNTYPQTFFPLGKSLYMLESNAGFAEKYSLSVGKKLNFAYLSK